MALFGRKKKPVRKEDGKELTIEDLITLERYEDAADKLKVRLKTFPNDLHAHLKLAEVYTALTEVTRAMDEYVFVADSLADDGFHDKGIALLAKAAKINPGDDMLPRRIEKLRRRKTLERRRSDAIAGLLDNPSTGVHTAGNKKLEVEMLWPKIARSHLVHELDGSQLRKLFSVMQKEEIEQGQVIAERGRDLQKMILCVHGRIEAIAEAGGRSFEIRAFSTGDTIGESALLERKPWPATYRVAESGSVFTLDRPGLEKAMIGQENPRQLLEILRKQHHDRTVATNVAKLGS
ncbi:MAG: cyclic nucleotide-binding domain-containing protein [Acidobacteriota bacterium]